MKIPDHNSDFRELRNNFLGQKLKFFDADPDPGSEIFLTMDPGSRMKKFGSGINKKRKFAISLPPYLPPPPPFHRLLHMHH
jgi:hypothetical protein